MMDASQGTGLTNAQIFPETGERKENRTTACSPGLVQPCIVVEMCSKKGYTCNGVCIQLLNLVKGDSLLMIIR